MKKNLKFMLGGIILMGAITIVGLKGFQSGDAGSNLRLANIEALAGNGEDSSCGSKDTCPNGGQQTKGHPDQKQKTVTTQADSNGSATYSGVSHDFGAEYANKMVTLTIGWVECTYNKKTKDLNCCSCNTYFVK